MDPCFWSNRIVGGGFVFDCSKHYRGIARLGMYLVRRGHQIRGVVGQLRNGHRDLPKKISGGNSLVTRKTLPRSTECNQNNLEHLYWLL